MFNLPYKKIYCIGIGGIGVAGLAELLHKKGYHVSGSDLNANELTRYLKSLGIVIYDTHHAKQISDADLVVYTSAINPNNSEFMAAKKLGIPLLSRGELLARIMQAQVNIIVTGTHGKTTTTALISKIFEQAGVNPTYFIGGILRGRQSPLHHANERFFIAEADESDASFLFLSPTAAVITNIDADHMDTYAHDFEQLKNSFLQMTRKIPAHGFLTACLDDPVVQELRQAVSCRFITYGMNDAADYRLSHFHQSGLQSEFQVHHLGKKILTVKLNLPGVHNALNAIAAIIIAREYQISDKAILSALTQFPGVERRFQFRGELPVSNGKALLFDDYGHHPNEIQATLKAARLAFPGRRMVIVFQPHRYSRTRDLMKEFARVLKETDQLILTEVYAANEEKILGADGKALYQLMQQMGALHTHFVPNLSELPVYLQKTLRPNDVVILQGAGNIVSMADILMK